MGEIPGRTRLVIDQCSRGSHVFHYGGVKFERQFIQEIGFVQERVDYFDWFWCERCLEMQFFLLHESECGCEVPKYGATPVPPGRSVGNLPKK